VVPFGLFFYTEEGGSRFLRNETQDLAPQKTVVLISTENWLKCDIGDYIIIDMKLL
jgi:hypothetical protein